jgi:predicted short-subunit dehydrogenase-like oxidoreductase (DUF2520 family)
MGLIGPGRAGRAFARSWSTAGLHIAWVLSRNPGRRPLGFDAPVLPLDATALAFCDLAVLAVPDDALTPAAEALAGRLSSTFAFHLSGAYGADAISPLRAGGASLGSLHPVRPFTGADDENWAGAFVAIEGDEAAAAVGERVASALGAHPHRLAATDRGLYHACATLAAGGTAALISIAARGWATAGIPEDLARRTLAGLAAAAADAAAARPLAQAFTGAVARRDVGTVRRHLAALAPFPEAARLYRALAEETLRRTREGGDDAEIRALLAENPAAT